MAKIKKLNTLQQNVKKPSKETMAEVIEEVAKSEGIFSAIGDGLAVVDRTFKILFENQIHKKMMGDHVGEHCYKAYTKKQGICGGCPVALSFKDGKVHRVQRELQNDKGILYLEITASPLLDTTGKIIAGIEVARDITDRKQAEEALKESEERYRNLYTHTPAMLHSIDREGRLLSVSEQWLKKMGYTREEVLGHRSLEFLTEESRRYATEVILPEFFQTGVCTDISYQMVTKDEQVLDVLLSATAVRDASDAIIRSLAVIEDITERKQAEAAVKESEQKLRNIVEHSNELYYVHDTHHVLSYASPQSLQILGYSPEEMMIEWTKLATENPINEKGMAITEKALKTGEKQEPYLLELYRKDGSKVLLEIDESPVKNRNGNVVGIVGAARDVTTRKQAEEALKKSRQQIRMLLDSTAEAIYGIDLEGNCTFVNKACLRILGYENENKLLGENIHNLIHFKYPDGSEYPVEKCKIYQAFKRGERINVDDEVLWKADGTNLSAEYWSYPMEEDGKIIGAVVTFIDITERKKAEELENMRTDQIILNKEALLELTRMQAPDFETCSKIITLMSSQVLGVERVSIWFYNSIRSEVICEALYILSKHIHEKGFRLQTKDYPEYYKALEENPVLAAADALSDPHTSEFTEQYLKPLGIFSTMDIPIRRHGEVIGVMRYESVEPRQWTYEDQHFAASVAHIITTALEDFERRKTAEALKTSEQELKERVNDLEDFYGMAVGRELRMKELKGEIAELKEELEKYKNK